MTGWLISSHEKGFLVLKLDIWFKEVDLIIYAQRKAK